MCRASVAITGAGVPFGATIPNQVANSYAGRPASADVGSRGTALSRCDCATAKTLARPASTGPRTAPQPANVSSMCPPTRSRLRSEEHTSELQSRFDIVCRLLLEKNNLSPQSHVLLTP